MAITGPPPSRTRSRALSGICCAVALLAGPLLGGCSPPPAPNLFEGLGEARAASLSAAGDALAFPGAVGPASATRGALGCGTQPVILTVNQQGDRGDGVCDASCTLRDALLTERPRFVVFNVSGTLLMDRGHGRKSDLELSAAHSCVTVAGQTSPGGVTLANAQLHLHQGFHDGIFRHLRIRPGIWERERGTVEGCNRWAWRCDSAPSRVGAEPGEPRKACEQHCPNSTCSRHEYGAYTKPNVCTKCTGWSPDRPDAYPGCNDRMLIHGNFLDAVRIEGPARNIILDSSSLTWAVDETLQIVGATPPATGPEAITIQNSILGAGNDSEDGASGHRYPGHRRSPHHFGVFITLTEFGVEARGMDGITLFRNLMLHNDLRSPMVACGRVGLLENVIYNGDVQDAMVYGRCSDTALVAVDNVFRMGPDTRATSTRRFGYCEGGRRPGKPCRAPLYRQAAAGCGTGGVCRPRHVAFVQLVAHPHVASVRLEGNRFEGSDGSELPSASGDGLDAQWSRAQINDSRRRFHEARPVAPLALGRRSAPAPREELVDQVLEEVGATLPARDAVDRQLVMDVALGRGGHGVPTGGYRYPELASPAWSDRDRDGICDRWERAHCPDGECAALNDLDADGYANLEEWINGTDPQGPGAGTLRAGGC